MRRAWARSVRGNPRGAEGRGRARLRGRGTPTREERETLKKAKKRGSKDPVGGVLRAGFCGRGSGFWRLKRSYSPLTPGTELYCGTA